MQNFAQGIYVGTTRNEENNEKYKYKQKLCNMISNKIWGKKGVEFSSWSVLLTEASLKKYSVSIVIDTSKIYLLNAWFQPKM